MNQDELNKLQQREQSDIDYLLSTTEGKSMIDDQNVNANIMIAFKYTDQSEYSTGFQCNFNNLNLIAKLELFKNAIEYLQDEYAVHLAASVDNKDVDSYQLFSHLMPMDSKYQRAFNQEDSEDSEDNDTDEDFQDGGEWQNGYTDED